jgi:hypothetical protein
VLLVIRLSFGLPTSRGIGLKLQRLVVRAFSSGEQGTRALLDLGLMCPHNLARGPCLSPPSGTCLLQLRPLLVGSPGFMRMEWLE